MPLSREADRERKRRARERQRAEMAAGAVVQFPAPSEVADAVKAELAGLPGAADRPGVSAAALRMAVVLDDVRLVPHWPSAARTLDVLLLRLHQASKGNRGGKLLAMRDARRE